jgi:hypothetical protein
VWGSAASNRSRAALTFCSLYEARLDPSVFAAVYPQANTTSYQIRLNPCFLFVQENESQGKSCVTFRATA